MCAFGVSRTGIQGVLDQRVRESSLATPCSWWVRGADEGSGYRPQVAVKTFTAGSLSYPAAFVPVTTKAYLPAGSEWE